MIQFLEIIIMNQIKCNFCVTQNLKANGIIDFVFTQMIFEDVIKIEIEGYKSNFYIIEQV